MQTATTITDTLRWILLLSTVAFVTSNQAVSAEECGHEELVQCAKPLQVISATSELSFVTNKDELDKICPWVDERFLSRFKTPDLIAPFNFLLKET